MKLSTLSILIGSIFALLHAFALAKPTQFSTKARQFPRHVPTGVLLMLIGTAWFVWNVYVEPIADFATIKDYMMLGFAGVGIGACLVVRDFLAVRGLAVVLLLVAKLMVDTGRPHLGETPWIYLFQALAYVFVVAGIWFTISPWRLRDIILRATTNESAIKTGSAIQLALALLLVALGFTSFRTM